MFLVTIIIIFITIILIPLRHHLPRQAFQTTADVRATDTITDIKKSIIMVRSPSDISPDSPDKSVIKLFLGSNKRDLMCSTESDDSFLRPPLWEDITSSIQNIDPENAIMLSTLTGATQVKLEAVDDAFLEPLSSPLLSPLEIKTEKVQISLLQSPPNHNNNNLHHHNHHNGHLTNNNNNNSYHNSSNVNHNNNNSYQLNGGGYGNGPPVPPHLPPHSTNGMHPSVHIHVQNNNYYTPAGWQNNAPVTGHNHQNSYPPKFSPQGNLCPPPMSRLMYVPPLTPPNSDPGSPINGMQVSDF